MDNIRNEHGDIGELKLEKKENDWFLALSENPSFSFNNFESVGLTPENTGLKSKDFYRNSEYIQEKFTNEDGVFDDKAFNNVYSAAAASYQVFSNHAYESLNEDNIKTYWDPNNFLKPLDGTDREIEFNIVDDFNPDRLSTGISGMGRVGDRLQSKEWLARQELIFDPETGEYEDKTVDERSLFTNILDYGKDLLNPLVLATWDEDGTHIDEFTGQTVEHFKGDPKFNSEGTYYYERLAGRDTIGKQFKSSFDNIIAIDSSLKKYDFFDSTDIDKSVTGSLFKTAFKLAPFAMGGQVKAAYASIMLGLELTNTLSTLYRMTLGDENSVIPNSILSITKGLKDEHVSEKSQLSQLTFENFMKVAEGVVFQWAEQRKLFKHLNTVFGTDKLQAEAMKKVTLEMAENPAIMQNVSKGALEAARNQKIAALIGDTLKRNNKIARNISVAYMSSMQGFTMFEESIAQGVDEFDATMVALGGTLGIYGVIRKMKLGELFLPEVMQGKVDYKAVLKDPAKMLQKELTTLAGQKGAASGANKAIRGGKIVNKVKNIVTGFWSDVANHTTTVGQKMVGEGLEELTEQVAMDLSRGIYNAAAELGITKNDNRLSVAEGMLERYASAFAGGAVGAGLFYALDFKQMQQQMNQQEKHTIINALSQEGPGKIIEKINKLTAKKAWGDDNLSATKMEFDDEGNAFYLPAESKSDTQNQYIGDRLVAYVKNLDNILNQEGINLTEDQVVEKFITFQQRNEALQALHQNSEGKFAEATKNGVYGLLLQENLDNTVAIVDARTELNALTKKYTDAAKSENTKAGVNPNYEAELAKYTKQYEDAVEKRNRFFSEENMAYQTRKMMFAMDHNISQNIIAHTFKDYVEIMKKTTFDKVSKGEIEELRKQYSDYLKGSRKFDLDLSFEIFDNLTSKFGDKIENQVEKLKAYSELKDYLQKEVIDTELRNAVLQSGVYQDASGESMAIHAFPNKNREIWNYVKDEYKSIEGAKKIVDTAKKIGFMDADVRTLVESLLPTIKTEGIGKEIFTKMKDKLDIMDPYTMNLAKTDSEFIKEYTKVKSYEDIDVAYKSNENLLTTEDVINSLNSKAEFEFLVQGKSKEWIETEGAKEFTNKFNEIIENYKKLNKEMADLVKSKIESDNSDTISILKDMDSLDTNPIFSFLDEISLVETGSRLTALDIIKQETQKFKDTKSVGDYDYGNRDAEIDSALRLIHNAKLMIKAALVEDITPDNPFGHNKIFNDFTQNKDLHKPVVQSDISNKMLLDLNGIEDRLNFFKGLTISNRSNLFGRHVRLGLNISNFFHHVLKGKNGFAFLNEKLRYGDRGLFDGLEGITVDSLDYLNSSEAEFSDNENTLHVNKDLNALQDKVYDNFHAILDNNPGVSTDTILQELFKDLSGILENGTFDLYSQETTNLTPDSTTLTNYDLLTSILSMISIKKSDYDSLLLETIGESDYAPLFAQEHIGRVILGAYLNPEIMNKVSDIASQAGGSDYVNKLYNTVIVDSAAGAGKTKVIIDSVLKMISKINPEVKVLATAPVESQLENLNRELPFEAHESMKADDLVRRIIGDEAFYKLQEDIQANKHESDLYEFKEDYKSKDVMTGQEVTGKALLIKEGAIKYSDNINIESDVIVLDENTHVNTIYSMIISKYAKDHGKIVVSVGNGIQLGYSKPEIELYNIESNRVFAIRTPKLNINMRSINSHKIANDNKLVDILSNNNIEKIFMDKKRKSPNADIMEVVRSIEGEYLTKLKHIIDNELAFLYHESDQAPITGDKLAKDISLQEINSLLDKVEEIGYIYSNENSSTYKLIEKINSDKIKMFKDTQVQGQEFDYVIIDSDFSPEVSRATNSLGIYNFLRKFYTLTSRAKEGSIIIDRGISDILKNNFNKSDREPTRSPKGSVVIERYKSNRVSQLEAALEGYVLDEYSLRSLYEMKQNNLNEDVKSTEPSEQVPETNEPLVKDVRTESEDSSDTQTEGEGPQDGEKKRKERPNKKLKDDEEGELKIEEDPKEEDIQFKKEDIKSEEDVKKEDQRKSEKEEREEKDPNEKTSDGDKKPESEPQPKPEPEYDPKNKRIVFGDDVYVEPTETGKQFLKILNKDDGGDEAEIFKINLNNQGRNKFTAYGFYNRNGATKNENGTYVKRIESDGSNQDLNILIKKGQILTEEQAQKKMEILNYIRDNILRDGRKFTSDNITDLKNKFKDKELNSLLANSLRYLNNGEYLIEVRNTIPSLDNVEVFSEGYKPKGKEVSFNLVYRMKPIPGTKDTNVITIGKIQAPDNLQQDNSAHYKPSQRYVNWYQNLKNHMLKSENRNLKLYVPVKSYGANKITGLLKSNDSRQIKLSVEQLRKDPKLKHAIFSDQIYAYAGKENEKQIYNDLKLSETINGKAVILTTVQKNVKFENEFSKSPDVKKVLPTPQNLRHLYEVRQKYRRDVYTKEYERVFKETGGDEIAATNAAYDKMSTEYPPAIRLLLLDPEGMWLEEYLDIDTKSIDDMYTSDRDKAKFMGTLGSSFTSARMIAGVVNMRANYSIFNNVLNRYKQMNGIKGKMTLSQSQAFNDMLDSRTQEDPKYGDAYAMTSIRLFSKKISPAASTSIAKGGYNSEIAISPIAGNTNGVYTSETQAANSLHFYNTFLNLVGKYLNIPLDSIPYGQFLPTTADGLKNHNGNLFSSIISNLNKHNDNRKTFTITTLDNKKIKVNPGDIVMNVNGKTEIFKGFKFDGSWRFSLLLGKLSKLTTKDNNYNKYNIDIVTPDGRQVQLNVGSIFFDALQKGIDIPKNSLKTFIFNNLKLAIHGRISKQGPAYSYAPMPNGIYESIVFRGDGETMTDLVEIYNRSARFTSDAIPRSKTMTVEIDYDGEVFNASKGEPSKYYVSKFETAVEGIFDKVNSLASIAKSPEVFNDIYDIQKNAMNDINHVVDMDGLNMLVNKVKDQISNTISFLIDNKGLELKGGDLVTSATYDFETGLLNINRTLGNDIEDSGYSVLLDRPDFNTPLGQRKVRGTKKDLNIKWDDVSTKDSFSVKLDNDVELKGVYNKDTSKYDIEVIKKGTNDIADVLSKTFKNVEGDEYNDYNKFINGFTEGDLKLIELSPYAKQSPYIKTLLEIVTKGKLSDETIIEFMKNYDEPSKVVTELQKISGDIMLTNAKGLQSKNINLHQTIVQKIRDIIAPQKC